MSSSNEFLKLCRQMHLYIGVFIAPALFFFAFTGAIQTFSLHETTPGSSYKPSVFLMTMAQIHKKQTWMIPAKKQRPDGAHGDAQSKHDDGAAQTAAPQTAVAQAGAVTVASTKPVAQEPAWKKHLPLKIFFLIVALGLFVSTLTGLYMSYKYSNNRLVLTLLFVAGMVIPLVLLPF